MLDAFLARRWGCVILTTMTTMITDNNNNDSDNDDVVGAFLAYRQLADQSTNQLANQLIN